MEDDLKERINHDLEDLREILKSLDKKKRKELLHYYISVVQKEDYAISIKEYNEFVRAFDDFEMGE